jgi:hypothetical protein
VEVAWPLSEVELPLVLPVVLLLLYVDPVLVLLLRELLSLVPVACCGGGQTWPGGQGAAPIGGR